MMQPIYSAFGTDTQGAFARAQSVWAEHKVATFPVKENKVAAIEHYAHIGLAASAKLVRKFPNAPALGFVAGPRSKITVLDVDTTDENVLSDGLARHGASPFIVRTGSGKFHAYYRWGGERRRIRPWDDLPIDIIGGGVLVVPPSQVATGKYEIIAGTLDDINRLPQGTWLTDKFLQRQQFKRDVDTGIIHNGRRGDTLWRHCMRNAKSCDDFDTLLDVARTFDANSCMPPIQTDQGGDKRVFDTAKSAWDITQRGMNRFGLHGVFFPDDEAAELVENDVDAFVLLAFLRSHNGPSAIFMCTNTTASKIGCGGRKWSHERLATARCRLIDLGYVTQVRKAGRGHPAFFKWTARR
jgi:hypothetical protein